MIPTRQDFEAVLDNIGTGVLIHDAGDKRILWANAAACQILGWSVAELQPLKAPDMSSPEAAYARPHGRAWLQEAVVSGASRRLWKYRTANGETVASDALATLIDYSSGPAVMVQIRPTERAGDPSRSEPALSSTTLGHARLSRLMSYSESGVLCITGTGEICEVSPRAREILGRSAEELIGTRLSEVGHWSPPLEFVELGDDRPTAQSRVNFTTPEGGDIWVAAQFEVQSDGDFSTVVILRECTEEVETEYRQVQLQYFSRFSAMGEMALILAHELGQPLSAARNRLAVMDHQLSREAGASREALIETSEHVRRQLERAEAIVSSVRNYVRRFESTAREVDLADVLHEALYFVGLRAKEEQVRIDLHIPAGRYPIAADPVLVGQAVLNLCINGIESMVDVPPTSRELVVTLADDGECFTTEVSDSGEGRDRIGSAFDGSAPVASTKKSGNGIGLLVSRQIVDRHGGSLQLKQRDLGTGHVAVMTLPKSGG